MITTSKNLPDQTAAARPRRRSPRPRPQPRKTRDPDLHIGKISLKPAALRPPANAFAKNKPRSIHRPETSQAPIPHSDLTQQNRG